MATSRPPAQADGSPVKNVLQWAKSLLYRLLFSGDFYWVWGLFVIVFELLLNTLIVLRVPYTEIDWIAYMQEVGGAFDHNQAGELNLDYTTLRGDTGPLVYPAGFVYLYYLLYLVTGKGANIRLAQWIFVGLHTTLVAVLVLVLRSVERTDWSSKKREQGIPPVLLLGLCFSKRIHSIFVLRLFNDCWAVFLCYIAILFFVKQRWYVGCIFYSLAVGIKMNILLFAPPLFLLLVNSLGLLGAIPPLAICALIQLGLGLPFLLENPAGYLIGSFDLGRKFFYIWTVNWKFLPEPFFVSNAWSIISLACHLSVLLFFAHYRWCAEHGGLVSFLAKNWRARSHPQYISPTHILELLLTGNFIGIAFARSLHYQFYVWYFHTLVFLFYTVRRQISFFLAIPMLIVIEITWNIFPASPISSFALFSCHMLILSALWATKNASFRPESITNQGKTD